MLSIGLFLVGLPGLEPGKAGPESAVLPLHHSPIISSAKLAQVNRTTKQNAKFFQIIFQEASYYNNNKQLDFRKKSAGISCTPYWI